VVHSSEICYLHLVPRACSTILIAAGLVFCASGCALTDHPVEDRFITLPEPAIGEGYVGLGFYRVIRSRPIEQVSTRRIVGVGLLIQSSPDRATLGYVDENRVVARLEGAYHLQTPVGYLAVGRAAETHGVKTILGQPVAATLQENVP